MSNYSVGVYIRGYMLKGGTEFPGEDVPGQNADLCPAISPQYPAKAKMGEWPSGTKVLSGWVSCRRVGLTGRATTPPGVWTSKRRVSIYLDSGSS